MHQTQTLQRTLITLMAALSSILAPAAAQTFTIVPNQVEISVAPGFNHAPLGVEVLTNAPGVILSNLTASSDSGWVTPRVEAAGSRIALSFITSNLVNSLYTATITATLAGQTNTFFVKAYVAPFNVFKLKDDPLRSRTYGIQQNGLALGSIVVFDPVTTNYIGNVTVGHKPSDLAESADGHELFVINCVDETVSVIDLDTLTLNQTLKLPVFDNWGVNDTTANIAVGPGHALYYTDGAWAPVLRVLDRATLQVLQEVTIDGNGFGDLALTGDKALLFGWVQYGWSAGWAGSYIAKYRVATNGILGFMQETSSTYPTTLGRDPLDTPVLVSDDDQTVFVKQLAVSSASLTTVRHSFPKPVYSITPGGEVAVTDSAIYETATGIKLADLPRTAPVQAISSDYSRLTYFDSNSRALQVLNLLDLLGPILNRGTVPPDGSITLSPARLQWSPLPGIDRYHLYLGQSQTAVATADTNSPLFLGSVVQPSFQLTGVLTPGTTYYWRVDAVSQFDVTRGQVMSFTVSLISCSPTRIDTATVRGHRDLRTSLTLDSQSPGLAWQAGADQSWISFSQPTGTTPATLEIALDASSLAAGMYQGNVTISNSGTALFSLPITLRVDALNLTVMKSRPGSVFSYAISEDSSTTPTRAYLLEINTVTEAIQRVTPVGSSATDLAIHPGDNRIYVPNWLTGSLLAIDFDTFAQTRAYAFAPFGGMGYSENDIYRVSAAGPGRLVWEEEDQWIDINIFDTVAGTNLASAFVREGGGECSPDRRYYYHGENNSSGAALLKFDLLGDKFTSLASARVATYSYYGSRTVVVSDNGNRVFWNGGVFDANLNVLWTVADQIYAASADGRYAFADTEIFDTLQHAVVGDLTPASTVKTFNSVTSKLIYCGTNGIAFYRMNAQGPVVPADGSILPSPPELVWFALAVPASYQLYLGQSPDAVRAAETNSPLYLGQVASTNFVLSPLPAGAYYWRVDAVTAYGTVRGELHSFVVSTISPSVQQISEITFPNRPLTATLTLTSPSPGEAWQATSGATWISLNQTNGTTPSTFQITLDPSALAPLVRTGSITISGAGGPLFTIPVQLTVEALHLTITKSDPASQKVYAISEDPSSSPTRAYLLEIDTASESIHRVVNVGSSVTDLAIHNGENRLYLPNWQTGSLLALSKSNLQQVQTYTFAPSTAGGGDVYRVAAGTPGRIVVEEEDQWVDMSLFDTTAGTKLATGFVREGGGAFGGNGRYYYHGDNNISDASIHKYDLVGDTFTALASARVTSVSYYGSRTVLVSDDGSRVFWNGSAFDANLAEQWTIGDEIFATSADARYAFSQTTIYDTTQKAPVLGMPVATAVSAFNSTTHKLVVQNGGSLAFFEITSPLSLPAPVLSSGQVSYNSVQLNWTDRSLERSFTLQSRPLGATNWTDIANPGANVTQYTATGLSPESSYEFRIKADAGSLSSPWSGILAVTTPAIPPTTPSFNVPIATYGAVLLTWSDPNYETSIVLERSAGSATNWLVLATLTANTTTYTDTNVISLTTYYYRLKATSNAGDSPYSIVRSVTVPPPQPPPAPAALLAKALSSSSVLVTWNDVLSETGYRLERRTEDPTSWALVASLPANMIAYTDTNLVQGLRYWYRVQAFNANGNSPYSNEADVVPLNIVNLIADDFDPALDHAVWASIVGGVATNGGPGFRGNNALYFAASGARTATTIPLDVSMGGTIQFLIRAGNEAADGPLWNNSETGETVALEYTSDKGATWSNIRTLDTVYPALSNWTSVSVTIPAGACGPATQFRWRQSANSGPALDCWALDDVVIQGAAPLPPDPVPFVISSASSSTSIAVFWVDSVGAAAYVVERKTGTQPWTPVATVPVLVTYYTDLDLLPGTLYQYRIQALNAGGAAAYSPTTSSLTWSQLEQWLADNYGSPDALTPREMTAPGPDGCSPILRYAFNLRANEPLHQLAAGQNSGYPRIWLDAERDRLCVEFVRRKPTTNPRITYAVEFCGEIPKWATGGTRVTTTSIDSIWERVLYEDSVTTLDAPSRFCRIAIDPSL